MGGNIQAFKIRDLIIILTDSTRLWAIKLILKGLNIQINLYNYFNDGNLFFIFEEVIFLAN